MAFRTGDDRPPNGGVPARRAIARWAWRLFRREWRQQALVLALLTVAIAAVIFGATAAYNMIPSQDAGFGTANVRVTYVSPDSSTLADNLATLRKKYGAVDVIERSTVPVPGSVDTVEVREQDPRGRYGSVMLALRAGRYPNRAGEVAVTDRVAELVDARLGHAVTIGGVRRTMVGIVENPEKLSDEFALVSTPPAARPDVVTVLAHGASVPRGSGATVICDDCRGAAAGHVEYRGTTERTAGAALVLGLSTVALLLVALVATAGFVVLAQRRTRQLGMLAAVGATGRHLRFVTLVNGAVVGVVAAGAGALIALTGWLLSASRLETAAGHRIARFDVPWWLVASGMVLAVATAVGAAWWPARTTARVPITDALSARPPVAKSTRRSSAAAIVFAAVGFISLAAAIDTKRGRGANAPLLILGVLAVVIAVVLIGPLAIRGLAVAGSRLPIAARLALRDLARYRARSAAALAAIGVGLGIAVAVVVITAGAQRGASEGNLSARQLVLRVGRQREFVPPQTAAQVHAQADAVEGLRRSLGDPKVIPLDAAASPSTVRLDDGSIVRPVAEIMRELNAHSFRGLGSLYVATPQLLTAAGVDAARVAPDADVLTVHSGTVFVGAGGVFVGNAADPSRRSNGERIRVAHISAPGYSSTPTSFITPAALHRLGFARVRTGWLIEADHALTGAQRSAAREAAARVGLTVEVRDAQGGLETTRTVATLAGMLLALAILAMTVGLIRSEAGRDLRTLTAAGATSGTRRMLTAVTAGALALLGVVIGAVAAYLALIASYLDDLDPLTNVPVVHLTVMIVGIPLVATIAAWLVSGREPATVARTVLD